MGRSRPLSGILVSMRGMEAMLTDSLNRIKDLENCLRVLARQTSGEMRDQILAALAGNPRKRD